MVGMDVVGVPKRRHSDDDPNEEERKASVKGSPPMRSFSGSFEELVRRRRRNGTVEVRPVVVGRRESAADRGHGSIPIEATTLLNPTSNEALIRAKRTRKSEFKKLTAQVKERERVAAAKI